MSMCVNRHQRQEGRQEKTVNEQVCQDITTRQERSGSKRRRSMSMCQDIQGQERKQEKTIHECVCSKTTEMGAAEKEDDE